MFVRAAAARDLVRDVGAHQLGRRRIAEHPLQDAARDVGGWLGGAPPGAPRRPRRDEHRRSVRAARRVGILIGPHVDAAVARALDQADRGGARSPVVRALRLEVRRDDARAGLLADRDGLAHRVEQRRRRRAVLARHVPQRVAAFAALVRDVDAAERPAALARARRLRRSCSSARARTRAPPTARPRLPAAPAAPARASSRPRPRAPAGARRRPSRCRAPCRGPPSASRWGRCRSSRAARAVRPTGHGERPS